MINIEQVSTLKDKLKKLNIDKLLEESEKELDNNNTKYLSHEEVFLN